MLKNILHFQRQCGPLQLEATGFPAFSLNLAAFTTKALIYFLIICFLLPQIKLEIIIVGGYLGISRKLNSIQKCFVRINCPGNSTNDQTTTNYLNASTAAKLDQTVAGTDN